MHAFRAMLNVAGVKHFTAEELFFRGSSDATLGLNTPPPQELWKNMIPTAVVADESREKLGHPIRVLSAYRSPAYNRRIGGAKSSQHMRFCALDLGTDKPALLYKILLEMRRDGKFKGGLGLYRTFVHLDTRGVNANWAA
jgi:lysozyme